jgi:hypothetical protein
MKTFRFDCHVCGKRHEQLPAFGFEAPAQLRAVPSNEQPSRVLLTADTCIIELDGVHHFVRAQLEIPIQQTSDFFIWGVWGSLSESSFARFVELFDNVERTPGETFFSWLSSDLPAYPDTMFLKSQIRTREYPLRPLVELERTDHPLAIDQHNGIPQARATELAASLLHSAQ